MGIIDPRFQMGKLKLGVLCDLAEVRQLLDGRPSSDCSQSLVLLIAECNWMCEPSVKLLFFQLREWKKSASHYYSCQRWEVQQAYVSASAWLLSKKRKQAFQSKARGTISASQEVRLGIRLWSNQHPPTPTHTCSHILFKRYTILQNNASLETGFWQ